MHPILIRIGPLTIHTYGFLFALGVLLAILLCFRLARREGVDTKIFIDFVFYALLLSLLGAKLVLLVTNLNYYLAYPEELKYLLTSGGTFYGGLIFGALFGIWFIRRHRLSYRQLGDIIGPGLALGHFFGRLGCFTAGCCFGRYCGASPLGVTFTDPYAHRLTGVPLDIPIYPTQLAEAALNLINFIFLFFLFRRRRFSGQVFIFYVLNYALIRFVVEYFRGDPDRGYVFGGTGHPFSSLSLPQLISVIGVAVALVLWKIFARKSEKKSRP